MSRVGFALDPRLAADTCAVTSLPLCDVLLMNDARYPWLILVPRRTGLVEIADLHHDEQAALWQEVNHAAAALRAAVPCDKLNLGALGNIVRQLHVHVVARVEGDTAWPRPVWGHGQAVAYGDDRAELLIAALQRLLATPGTADT
jgi:diadenosine tetraphosphate (Ap4A) HIT family hydrolase